MKKKEFSLFRREFETVHDGSCLGADEWFEPDICRAADTERSDGLSRWSQSGAKRLLELSAILICAPIALPILAGIALAVWITSGSPVIFRQLRAGRGGAAFTIYKFRTMFPASVDESIGISANCLERITGFGSILCETKLDELPQLWNVLRGDMSLVGPRPKVLDQQDEVLLCRPGLTGAATLAFATEETMLTRVPRETLKEYFKSTVLPAKRRLDEEYMRRATAYSDLLLITDTVLGRWHAYGFQLENIGDGTAAQSSERESKANASLC